MKDFSRTIFLFSFLCLLFLPVATHAATLGRPANNLGLAAYWKFDEGTGTALGDFSGNGNTGTFSGSPTWSGGKFGNALTFTRNTGAASGFVQVPDSASLKPGSGSMTISFWIKPSITYADGSNYNIIEKNIDSTSPGWGIYRDAAGNLKARLSYASSFVDAGAGNFATNFATSTWAHAVLVVDRGTNTAYWYKNGVALGSATDITAVTSMTNSSILDIGAGNEGIGLDTMGGSLDEIRIYNRALSATEISNLYKVTGAALKAPSKNNLAALWDFNEGTSTRAGDTSGQGNAATLAGATLPVWTTGKFGRGLSFDGSAAYADAANGSSINFGANQDFSISLWVKTSSSPGSAKPLAKYNVDTTGLGWGFYQAGGNLYLKVGDGSSVRYEQNVASINDNQWHHVVYSVSRAGNCVRYRDGVLVGTTDCSAWSSVDFSTNNRNLYMGANNNSNTPASYWSGSLDDVRIYNKALTAAEVGALYKTNGTVANVNTAGGSLTSGLLAYWSFNGADITDRIFDRIGNFNGYLTGTNNATSTRKTTGKVGQGFSFGGQNTGGVDLGNSTSLNPSRFTIAAWINAATSTYAYNYIYSNDRDCCGTYNGISLGVGIVGNAGKLVGMLWNSSQYVITSNAIIATSTWVHVAYSYDGSNTRLYINGALDKTQAQTTDPGTPASFNTYLGSMGNSSGAVYTFNGKLDEIRLYNRALSSAEIKQIYNAGK